MITSVGVVITSYLRGKRIVRVGELDIQLDDVGVSQDFEILDLPLHAGVHIRSGDLGPVDQLEGNLMTGDTVGCDWMCQQR
jgi:hypothetical protein